MTVQRVYLFKRFERFWHWSQAALVIALLYTGFVIHGYLPGPGYRTALQVHELGAMALVLLWVFAIFWHFTTGEWKQYIPTLDRIVPVARYYAWGMFRGESHPYHPTPERKHNPLQRLAYLGFKLLISPLLWLSGIPLLLYADNVLQRLPLGVSLQTAAWVHTSGAYLMLTFFIAHVYLATTGKTPLSYIRTMVSGWETVDEPEAGHAPGA